jgi:hypothetical protein
MAFDASQSGATAIMSSYGQRGGQVPESRVSGDYDEDDAVEPAERLLRWYKDTTGAVGRWGGELWRGVMPSLDRLLSDPVILAAIEAPHVTSAGRPRRCHCLCQAVHPTQPGICQEDAAVTTRRFLDVDLPLCAPCAAASTAPAP